MAEVLAWKRDAKGLYMELLQEARKDYSIDWTDWLASDTIASAALTLAAGVTQAGNCEIAAGLVKFTLVATGAKGDYAASLKMTSAAGLIEFVKFRVQVG